MRVRLAILLAATIGSAHVFTGQRAPDDTAAQQPPPLVFRSRVESVRLDVIVTDARGNPVMDLAPEDLEVREDNAVQTIQQFSRVVLPMPDTAQQRLTSGPAPGPRPDVAGNDQSQERIYVIVLGSLSWPEAARATKVVSRFLDRYFDDTDLAAVVTLDRRNGMQFTKSRTALMNEMDAFVARFAEPLGEGPGVVFRLRRDVRPPSPHQLAMERAEVFRDIARSLGHIEARRKSIIFISNGLGFDPYDAIDMPKSSFSEVARTALEPIMSGNLAVYPIYPGVEGPRRLRTMRALARVSGGVPTGADINRTFRQIVRDNSAYYVIGYDSTNARRDGGYRRIRVRAKRPGLHVRTRDGYFVDFPEDPNPNRLFSFSGRMGAPPPAPLRAMDTPAMTEVMASPVALTALPITVFAAPYRAASDESVVTVVLELAGSGLDLVSQGDGRLTGTVDIAIAAEVGRSTLRGIEYALNVDVEGAARDRVVRDGLRVTSEVRLRPGQYRLHVGAGSRGGRTGKAFYDLTVPDFTSGILMMSGVSLTSRQAAEMPTVTAAGTRQTGMPLPPSVARTFRRDETIVAYAELYENIWWTDSDHPISLTTELRSEDGRVTPMTAEVRSSGAPQLPHGGHGFVAHLPLDAVSPGAYVLRVEGRADVGSGTPVVREVPIQVR